jgi:hypothetical protein
MIPLLWYLLFPKAEGAKKNHDISQGMPTLHHEFTKLFFEFQFVHSTSFVCPLKADAIIFQSH